MKSREEIMNMLEAFDLTGSLRDAGELAGCSHHTVAAYVAKRDEGRLGGVGPVRRERIIDPWLPKIEEWVERSCGKIRADRAFGKLTALGYTGSERTVRRAVAEVKANHRRGRRRVYRPWIPEPGSRPGRRRVLSSLVRNGTAPHRTALRLRARALNPLSGALCRSEPWAGECTGS